MEDTSDIEWAPEKVIASLKDNPHTIKSLTNKAERIFIINSYNEREYLPELIEVYTWIRLVAEGSEGFQKIFENDRVLKFFIQNFTFTIIKYMQMCNSFKLLQMMMYTQQIMIQGLRLFMRYFDQLQKYPRMTLILKHIFDFDKQFYKVNYSNPHYLLIIPPTRAEVQQVHEFVRNLKSGDRLDVLKTEQHSRRMCWLPATFKKMSTLYCHVRPDEHRSNLTCDLSSMQVRPYGSMKQHYEWRMNLKEGDQVDYLKDTNVWIRTTVIQKSKESPADPSDESEHFTQVKLEADEDEWVCITDPRIQKFGSITRERPDGRLQHQFFFEDYNDYVMDPQMTQKFVCRPETIKSFLVLDLLNYSHSELHLFEKIAKTIKQKSMKIQVVADLIHFILIIHPHFHRKLALQFLSDFVESVLDYINNSKQGTIRNFSKDRYEAVMTSLAEFMKRLIPVVQWKQKLEKLQMDLIQRFLFSDFLDRKLQAVTMLTNFFKMCRNGSTRKHQKQLVNWVRQHKVLASICNQKSHEQLISKSNDFLREYLEAEPSVEQLQPLLVWNDAILKLVSTNFSQLPKQIQRAIVENIQSRSNVTNPDALSIIKKTHNPQAWLLKNGGDCWVEVVKQKTKRKAQIPEVFKQPFAVVNKITKEMNELYDSSFKSMYFNYMFEINYLVTVLQNKNVGLSQKLQFISLATSLIKKITDAVFDLLLQLLVSNQLSSEQASKFQSFFIKLMPKLQSEHLRKLFMQKFTNKQQLINMTETEFLIFKKCFIEINDNFEQQRVVDSYVNGKKGYNVSYILRGDMNSLFGLQIFEWIIFHAKNSEISKQALIFIGDVLLASEDQDMITQYTNKLLQIGLSQLYEVSEQPDSPQKSREQERCIKNISQIMNQSEFKGVDRVPSVHALFPSQSISIKVVDNFNVVRRKINFQVDSNQTLFEFRTQICRYINAYLHETKMTINGKQINPRYNGHLIHTLDLDGDIHVQKIKDIPRVSLLDDNGNLNEKTKNVFKRLFKQYSSFGLMSKKQCMKYNQKLIGNTFSDGESKVDKIFDQYDKDKDGYLTEDDFLSFYEMGARSNETRTWNNIEAFGIRNDLQMLDNLPLEEPDRDTLVRSRLYDNEKFINILFNLLNSNDPHLAKAAWNLAARMPLNDKVQISMDLTKQFQTRYWLYEVERNQQFEKITKQVLKAVMSMSLETVCIGQKVALQCETIDIQYFDAIIDNLKNINLLDEVDFFHKVILEYSLKIFSKFVLTDQKITEYYVANYEALNKVFRKGILSNNLKLREKYCSNFTNLTSKSVDNFKLFESLFNLIYRIFDTDLSTLNIEYFQLFSNLLTILQQHSHLMQKLQLNWSQLTQQIIGIYKSHQCTESSMTSKPDDVAIGLLKIISKLVNSDTLDHAVDLVPFIFQQSLFPENGRNKLKTSKSREDAYGLIYEICKFQGKDGISGGLQKLFDAGFKQIYRKMSSKKSSETFSYYYSFNESRSELGYAGIRNLGCICYMISMLQQLYMSVPFRNLILMADDNEPECLTKRGGKQIDDNVFHQFKLMFGYLLLTQKQEYNPDEFCFSFKDWEGMPVNTSVQQDAQEFINILFDKLETSLKTSPFKHILQNIFGGKSCSQTTCLGCGAVNERLQNFYPLSLDIKGFKNIQQSFAKYIEGQKISEYQCDACKNKCDVTKRNLLETTPNNFIIHLKRIIYNYDRLQNEKVNSRWQFPHELNLYDYTLAKQKGVPEKNGQFTYKLRGIVVHYGTADFGHYFSYIKQGNNQWIQFNDERVREFDPTDIEVECFGGEHWRRQSQSAYLLVYERDQKSPVTLEFSSDEEKNRTLEEFRLEQAVIEETKQIIDKSESQISKTESEDAGETKTTIQLNEQKQKASSQVKQQPKKILVNLNMSKVNQIVPKNIKHKIDQQNDQFSFTMNLSNNQFAVFIYNILSINPPLNLRSQYLQLCYECLHLKQSVKVNGKSINIAEWAASRFTELIGGSGWEFMKSFGQNWEGDILNYQKSTRVVTKCILSSIVKDIINYGHFDDGPSNKQQQQQERDQKRTAVLKFLDRLSNMMLCQVVKHWNRFQQYFELWISFVKDSAFIRRYCDQNMMGQKILQFVMQSNYPYSRSNKRIQMGNNFCNVQFEYPLQLFHALLLNGYQLNEMEQKCLKTYDFMNKIIRHRVQGLDLMQKLCKNNSVISQRMGYLLLDNISGAQQSDQVRPLAASVEQYIAIDDDLRSSRVQWIVGFPNYVQHNRQKGYGSFGCVPSSDAAVTYISALGVQPLLQLITKFRKKSNQVCCLLITLALQLEHDGYINNLDEYPSKVATQTSFTAEFDAFVNKYYDQIMKPYTMRTYIEYGTRIKRLWDERPNRPFKNPFPRILMGKVVEEVLVKQEVFEDIFQISQYNVKVHFLPLNQSTQNLTGKNILSIKGNHNFVCSNLPKSYNSNKFLGHYSIVRVSSSDQQQNQSNLSESIFDSSQQGWLLRKIEISNKSHDDMVAVFGLKDSTQCNLHVPGGQMSVQIQQNSKNCLTLIKQDLQKEYGELSITLRILGQATSSGCMPRQIITEVDQRVEDPRQNNSDDDEDDDCSSDHLNP